MTPRGRSAVAVGALSVLLGGVMVYSVVTEEMTGRVYSTEDTSDSQSRAFEAPDGGTYAFMATQPGREDPVTYDPCETIRVVVNEDLAPRDAEQILDAAIDAVEAASGLTFEVIGTTDAEPMSTDDIRDGDDFRPVQISWSDPDTVPDLSGDVAGLGGSTWLETDGHRWYVTGEVVLDAPDLRRFGTDVAIEVLMHELAHVIGLAHVDDDGELMHPSGSQPDWGPGDRAGLELLGQGRCG